MVTEWSEKFAMATLQIHSQIQVQIQPQYMSTNTFISRTSRRIRFISSYSSLNVTTTTTTTKSPSLKTTKASNAAQLKQNWLDSLSISPPKLLEDSNSGWVVGVDPDASGALALLKPDHSAQVWTRFLIFRLWCCFYSLVLLFDVEDCFLGVVMIVVEEWWFLMLWLRF